MKAITLHQPYATLVAIGAKKIETRSWSTKYRGPLAIHAGRNTKFIRGVYDVRIFPVFREALMDDSLPLGCVVATCELVDVVKIDVRYASTTTKFIVRHSLQWSLGAYERAFGDYREGRYMWLLDNVERLPEPVAARGSQGFWEWTK